MKWLGKHNQHNEVSRLKPVATLTMLLILSCIFISTKEKKKAPQQTKCNPIHLAILTIEERSGGRPCEPKINTLALWCAEVNAAK